MDALKDAAIMAVVALIGIGVRWVEKRALRKSGQLKDKDQTDQNG